MSRLNVVVFLVAVVLFATCFTSTVRSGEPSPRCKVGDYWKFDIRSNQIFTSNRMNGVYTILCTETGLTIDHNNPGYVSETIPTVLGLGADVPWFRFPMKVGDQWHYDYIELAPGGPDAPTFPYRWSATFEVLNIKQITIKAGTFTTAEIRRTDRLYADTAQNKYTYYVSEDTKSAVEADGVWAGGTVFRVELIEYGNDIMISTKGQKSSEQVGAPQNLNTLPGAGGPDRQTVTGEGGD